MGCLYRLTFPNGKAYIGITTRTAEIRFKRHVDYSRNARRSAVHHAILKYGAENVVVETLVIADDLNYLRELEKRAVQKFGTLKPGGYNLTGGGEDSHFWAAETLAKATASQKRYWAAIPIEQRRHMNVDKIAAMKNALSDPQREAARRKAIVSTMRSVKTKIARGERRPNSKLTPIKIDLIRALAEHKIPDNKIAQQFNVSRELIRDVRLGKRWLHV